MSRLGRGLVVVAALLASARAWAYPQFVAKGYTNCGTCHYSPSGGGLPNSYGVAVSEATVPDVWGLGFVKALREAMAKHDVTGHTEDGAAAWQWDVGLDTRFMTLQSPTQAGAKPSWVFIPMLTEAMAVGAYGPLLAYAGVTVRSPRYTIGDETTVFSREHWLEWKLSEGASVRVGRLVLPYGVRMPDHTIYTRADLGFDKYAQSYAAEWDWATQGHLVSVAAFAGDLVYVPAPLQERGLAVSLAHNVEGRGAFGLSVLAGHSTATNRLLIGPFLRMRLVGHTYVLGELDGEYRLDPKTGAAQQEAAGLLRLGWFPLESLDLYAELGGRVVAHAWSLTRLRYIGGAEWKVLPWVELGPAAMLEEDVESGRQTTLMAQLHVMY